MVSRAIYNLDASKATDPDRIPAIILNMCSPELSTVLAKQYNKCLAESCFPSCWKSSSVVPVFKNDGERSDPGKHRHYNLLPIISKIFESFINDSMTKHLDTTGFFSDHQYGSRAFWSTADILTVLSERLLYNSLDAGGVTRALHWISQRQKVESAGELELDLRSRKRLHYSKSFTSYKWTLRREAEKWDIYSPACGSQE